MILDVKGLNEEQIEIDVTADVPPVVSNDPEEDVYDKVDTYSQDVAVAEDPIEGIKDTDIDSSITEAEDISEKIKKINRRKALGAALIASSIGGAYAAKKMLDKEKKKKSVKEAFENLINAISEGDCEEYDPEYDRSVDVEKTQTICPTCSDTVDPTEGDAGDITAVVNDTMRKELDAELAPATVADGDTEGIAEGYAVRFINDSKDSYILSASCKKLDEAAYNKIGEQIISESRIRNKEDVDKVLEKINTKKNAPDILSGMFSAWIKGFVGAAAATLALDTRVNVTYANGTTKEVPQRNIAMGAATLSTGVYLILKIIDRIMYGNGSDKDKAKYMVKLVKDIDNGINQAKKNSDYKKVEELKKMKEKVEAKIDRLAAKAEADK